jgi:hypothetical protein
MADSVFSVFKSNSPWEVAHITDIAFLSHLERDRRELPEYIRQTLNSAPIGKQCEFSYSGRQYCVQKTNKSIIPPPQVTN